MAPGPSAGCACERYVEGVAPRSGVAAGGFADPSDGAGPASGADVVSGGVVVSVVGDGPGGAVVGGSGAGSVVGTSELDGADVSGTVPGES